MFWTTTAYDVLNRPVSVTRPVNSNGQTPTQTTDYTYAGRTTTITDPYSNTKTLIRDVNGWLRQTKDAYGYTVTLAYDQAGSKTEVTDSASATLWQSEAVTGYPSGYAYGIKPLLLKAMDADLGTWSYTYDALGELTGWWDAKNQGAQNPPFTMTYDALSRPLTRTEPDYFTQWTWGASASSHNVGTLQSVCTGVGSEPTSCTSSGYSEAESYDSLARLYQRAITIPSSGTYTYTSQYNSTTGLLNTFTYPVSTNGCQVTVQYGYTNGILASLTDASNATQCGSTGTVFWTADSTNPAGQVTEETLGNHIVTNRTYDAVTHWLSSVQSGVSGGSGVQNQAFLFDEMGDVTQRQDNNRGLTENIYYDDDYRLSSSTLGGTQNLSITYAANGNISSRSDVASGANWTYDSVHLHAVDEAGSSSYQYSYDANGNAVTRQGNSISWSSYNYPTSISAGSGSTAESVALAYGPGRQRWSQYYTGNSTTEQTYYVGDLMEVISSGGITAYRHYINAGSEAVGIYSRASTGNSIDYVLSDHQSSVASITNSSGGVIVPESFTPFGARRNPTTWSGAGSNTDLTTSAAITRQAYTFQTQLGLWMGMNHMNGRVQDDITGRFLGVSGILCVKA
jgi:YD repeat-containing protein